MTSPGSLVTQPWGLCSEEGQHHWLHLTDGTTEVQIRYSVGSPPGGHRPGTEEAALLSGALEVGENVGCAPWETGALNWILALKTKGHAIVLSLRTDWEQREPEETAEGPRRSSRLIRKESFEL